jgi:hypothetical protein
MISVQQLEALNKSDKLSEGEKATLNNNRFKSINTEMARLVSAPVGTPMNPDVKKSVSGLSDEELALIDPEYLKNPEFVGALRPAQVEAINKSKKFTKNQKDSLKKLRTEPLLNALRSMPVNATAAQNILKKMGDKDRAGLMSTSIVGPGGSSVLIDPAVLPIYTARMLKRMAQEMNAPDIQTLRNALIAGLPPTNATRVWLEDPTKGGEDFN